MVFLGAKQYTVPFVKNLENVFTDEDLKRLQSYDLNNKVQITMARIMEYMNHFNNQVYISFSGGKDSTVLADMAARVCKLFECKLVLWFSDTGLEYPELKEHVKSFPDYLKEKYDVEVELVIDYPKDKDGKRITFKQVIEQYGYPLISKETAKNIYYGRKAKEKNDIKKLNRYMYGARINPKTKEEYQYMKPSILALKVFESDIPVSNKCCSIMKKRPAHEYEKSSGRHPIIGEMAEDSKERKQHYLESGCNAFDKKRATSKPMGFWLEQDVLEYITRYEIPYPSVYGDILQDENNKYYTTGVNRTGCIFCGFGCHLQKEPNKFQQLKLTHPA